MKELLLAFEGGGTKTRIILAETGGTILQTETGGSSSALYIDPKKYATTIRSLLKRLRRTADKSGGTVVCAGLAAPMDQALVESLIREAFGDVQLAWLSEADIALALYDLSWGISLVAGTGSSCRFLTRDGVTVICGGLGPQFGDEGSGYWIGKEAIAAAMRAETSQGPPTVLLERLRAFYELERMWHVLRLCDRSGHVPGPRVAACVPEVIACARDGDAIARTVLRHAGRALGDLVLTTTRKARVKKGPVPLVLTGGVFRAGALVLNPLKRTLRTSPLAFTMYPEAAEPASGIIRILSRDYRKGM
ncbi:MAG: ATPase, BadF/BadG/BcrA/BcrD type [Candidatus Hydrogenedentota bacterium]